MQCQSAPAQIPLANKQGAPCVRASALIALICVVGILYLMPDTRDGYRHLVGARALIEPRVSANDRVGWLLLHCAEYSPEPGAAWTNTDKLATQHSGGVPGSRITSKVEAEGLRSTLACLSRGRWVFNPEPRPLPWSTRGLDTCDRRWANDSAAARAGFKANNVTGAAEWNIRNGLKYEWQPAAECAEWQPFDRGIFCATLKNLGGPVMVVGDALSGDMMHSINNHLQLNESMPQEVHSTPAPCSLWEATGKMDPALGLCRSVPGCEFPVFLVRNDRLTPVEHAPAAAGAEHYLPWITLIGSWGVKAVVLNRGALFTETPQFAQELEASLLALRQRYPDILLLYRATPPGHKGCESMSEPLQAPQDASALPDHWGDFQEQNAIARGVVEKYRGVFLDVEGMTALRGDGHKGRVSVEGREGTDCLRYCTPGPVDAWTRLLYNALTRLLPMTPPASKRGGYSCSDDTTPLVCGLFRFYQNSISVLIQPQPAPAGVLTQSQPPPASVLTQSQTPPAGVLTQSQAPPAGVLTQSKSAPEYDVIYLVVAGFRGQMRMADEHLSIAAEMALPSSRVHVLTDSPQTIAQVRRLAAKLPWGHRLRVRDVRPLLQKTSKAFFRKYRHQSVNNREFEAYCFWRWGVIATFVRELSKSQRGVSRVYTLDADVLPTRPFAQWLPRDFDGAVGRDITMVKLVPGAGILWTPGQLTAYWSFIQGLYASRKRTEWFVKGFGERKACRREAPVKRRGRRSRGGGRQITTEVLPCSGKVQLHVSDMESLKAFMAERKSSRRSLWAGEWLYRTVDPAAHAQVLRTKFAFYSCVPMSRAAVFSRGKWTLVVTNRGKELAKDPRSPRGWNVMLPGVDLPACYAHFQGNSKKAMPILYNLIKARVNGSAARLF